MRFIIQTIAIFILAYLLEMFLPWYSVAVAAFVLGYLLKSNVNFLAGFLAIGLLWFTKAWMLDANSTTDLAGKVALIFPVKEKIWLMTVAALLAALVGGFAALSGALLKPQKRKSYYR
ncbi:MAG TPA: hypothetical protein VIM75_21870 [Ohtaekwangia sp.]|uniref:hypothetical protein n=1 Tax=Ohtaekwangia sp. TaxID=2066019 RepID=UPI002F93FCC2